LPVRQAAAKESAMALVLRFGFAAQIIAAFVIFVLG
jgi:hypothetical protein